MAIKNAVLDTGRVFASSRRVVGPYPKAALKAVEPDDAPRRQRLAELAASRRVEGEALRTLVLEADLGNLSRQCVLGGGVKYGTCKFEVVWNTRFR